MPFLAGRLIADILKSFRFREQTNALQASHIDLFTGTSQKQLHASLLFM